MNRPGQTTLRQGRQLTRRSKRHQSLDLFVGLVVTQIDPELLSLRAGYPGNLAQFTPCDHPSHRLIRQRRQLLQSSGHMAKLTGLLGLQPEDHAGVMNRAATSVVKVVAMPIHRQKTPPQQQAIAGQSAAGAASEMVDGVRAKFSQLLGIQVSRINIHSTIVTNVGPKVKIRTGQKWRGYKVS
ncbi:hypothetical protein IV102_16480 [bacterium]|nr:hypothetical protein [bacterium]